MFEASSHQLTLDIEKIVDFSVCGSSKVVYDRTSVASPLPWNRWRSEKVIHSFDYGRTSEITRGKKDSCEDVSESFITNRDALEALELLVSVTCIIENGILRVLCFWMPSWKVGVLFKTLNFLLKHRKSRWSTLLPIISREQIAFKVLHFN